MPSAQSRPTEPEGMTSTSTFGASPSFMMDSSPNFVCISRMAASMAVVSAALREPTVFFSFSFFLSLYMRGAIVDNGEVNGFCRYLSEPVFCLRGEYSIPGRGRKCFVKTVILVHERLCAVDGKECRV